MDNRQCCRYSCAGVVALLRGADAIDVRRAQWQGHDRLAQRRAQLGQLIVDARRNGRRHVPADQPVALEIAQREGQHALRHAVERRFNSEKRFDPLASFITTCMLHLSPTRLSTGVTRRQDG